MCQNENDLKSLINTITKNNISMKRYMMRRLVGPFSHNMFDPTCINLM